MKPECTKNINVPESREIAATAAGDADLRTGPVGMVQHEHGPAAFAAFNGAHEPRRSSPDDNDVFFNVHGMRITPIVRKNKRFDEIGLRQNCRFVRRVWETRLVFYSRILSTTVKPQGDKNNDFVT